DLVVVVVAGGNHGRSGCRPYDAADLQTEILGAFWQTALDRGLRRGGVAGLGSEGRDLSIRRIDHDRGAQSRADFGGAFEPSLVIRAGDVGFGGCAATVTIRLLEYALGVSGRFFFREKFLALELLGALERREAFTTPDALQVGLSVRSSRRGPGFSRRGPR